MTRNEKWLPVVDWPRYEVSTLGHVRTTFDHSPRGGKANKSGHMPITLSDEGTLRRTYVHILVAEAHIGPAPSERHMVLHRDDVPSNNYVGNLYWGTKRDNGHDAARNGRNAPRTECPRGHSLHDGNLWAPALRKGRRTCLACRMSYTRTGDYSRAAEFYVAP